MDASSGQYNHHHQNCSSNCVEQQSNNMNNNSNNIRIAQRLNNQGAQLLQAERYEDAMNSLIHALKISERVLCFTKSSSSSEGGGGCRCCNCQYCTLEYCMSISFDGQQQQQQEHAFSSSSSSSSLNNDESDSFCGYLCTKPIFVPSMSIQDGHQMGMTLSLIIIFNLALTYHLTALQYIRHYHQQQSLLLLPTTTNEYYEEQLNMWLGKGKKLYEVAYRLQSEGVQQREVQSSIRFMMIVSNNLGEIHRLVNDTTKHAKCLEHLLSTMMYYYVVDNTYSHNTNNNNNNKEQQHHRQHEEMEGFLKNTSHLILRNQCANAA